MVATSKLFRVEKSFHPRSMRELIQVYGWMEPRWGTKDFMKRLEQRQSLPTRKFITLSEHRCDQSFLRAKLLECFKTYVAGFLTACDRR